MESRRRGALGIFKVVSWLGCLAALAVPTSGAEMEVHASRDREGEFWVQRSDGSHLPFAISQRQPAQPRESRGFGDCVDSDWPRDGFELIVSRRDRFSVRDLAIIPLRTPVTVVDVKAAESGNAVVLAVRGEYECSHHRGESFETTWFIVELSPKVRLLRQSRIQGGGRTCFPGDVARAQVDVEPELEFRDGALWFRLPLRSWVCYAGGERRGWFEWPVGHQPAAADLEEFASAIELARRAQDLGYQPYRSDSVGFGLVALWAENPFDLGGARFLGLETADGARGVVFLPRNGFQGGHTWRVDNLQSSAEDFGTRPLPEHLESEWPEAADIRTFHWSEAFLAARDDPRFRLLLSKGRVQIFELAMPCLKNAYPQPTKNEEERWVVQTEQEGSDLRIRAALLETCADHLAILGRESAVGFPESHVEVEEEAVRVRYGDPTFDVTAMERSKFLFDYLEDIDDLYPYEEVIFELDGAVQSIERSTPAAPERGEGWTVLHYPTCDFRVSYRAGSDAMMPREKGFVAPRLVEPDETFPPCQGPEVPVGWCSISGNISSNGEVSRLQLACPEGWPGADLQELRAFVEQWVFDPAADPDGQATSGFFYVDVSPRRATTGP